MQDHLSKYCLAEPIPDLKATTIAEAMAKRLIAQFGAPRAILTDRGAAFTGNLLREMSKIFHIKQVTTSGYRPQTNGALERSHILLAEYIKQYAGKVSDLAYVLKEPRKGKFDSQYHGPYKIVQITDHSNIILEAENGKRIRKHADKVKLAVV
ncbi:uncharacterized protein LOC124294412 [Neodiprion lecontei]|uniref:Uncharacterized protein LOC124294412 n=1 Tax=Neodiprion lecontei TaxID=441921 RepID=A0ABM3G4Y5_NEOLC|nr:uncharacterized protein LOC124294412 [Neodiprion lecontei]